MKLRVDRERAAVVARRIHDAITRREGLLAEVADLVENQRPEGVAPLSREHALFLFYTVPNDHGMRSSRLYGRAKELYRSQPDLFEPTAVLESFSGPLDPGLVSATGQFLSTRYPRETAKNWYLNSERIHREYADDPRNLFAVTSDARELLRAILRFRGFGPKTGGMLLRAVVGLGFAHVNGLEDVLVPVDVHDTRIAFLTGVVWLAAAENGGSGPGRPYQRRTVRPAAGGGEGEQRVPGQVQPAAAAEQLVWGEGQLVLGKGKQASGQGQLTPGIEQLAPGEQQLESGEEGAARPAGAEHPRYVRIVQEVLRDACRDAGVPWPEVDRGLWLIGSRGCSRRGCAACPVRDLCHVGRG